MSPASFSLSLSLLRLRLLLMKIGGANAFIAALIMLACATYLVALPRAQERLHAEQRKLALMKQARDTGAVQPAPAPQDVNEVRLAQFYDILGERDYPEQQLKVLFAIAGKTSLTLRQADYKWGEEGAGRFTTYRVALPVQGSYGAIEQFCEQVLLAMPFSSLDQLNFKREAVGNHVVDAQLNFTLYLSDQATDTADQPRQGSDQ